MAKSHHDGEGLDRALGPRYRLIRRLGSGGMSTVYAAWDEEAGREVALKVLLPELSRTVGADRFAREIEIATNLRHPHILPVYGSGSAEEILYYTMPVVEGETLRERLDREGQLAIEESLEIARQVSGALHYAHEQGVVHRDIKPENIMLSDGGAVVMDFGIARAVEEAGGDRLTETGLAMGTPAYMSPEQAEGSGRVDGRSDQYSLACVLYEMLAGHPPFQGRSSQIVLNRAAKDPVPPLSSARRTVPVPVEAVIERALSKVAADRFASAEAFGEALTLAERGVTPPGVTPAALGPRYRISRELGEGGMATVYLAWDEEEGREVALKVLLPELTSSVGSERFLREIGIASKLTHPHILPLHGSGQTGGVLYYTMPHVEGETLRERLDREGQLPIDESLEIARQVAGALHYAHERGVVHRDIKPENIMLSDGGAVVMDFGIARAIDSAGGDRLTETGLAMGTPAYMSPEQAEGNERLDGRSDQYSLACVLYEMLAGHPPFAGPSSQVVLSRAAKDPVPPLSSARRTVSVPVEAVIHKALSKVAADRFASAEAFGEALTLAERDVTPPGVTPGHVTPGGVTPWELGRARNVWTELARRRVYQVAVSYLVVAWAVIQVAEATFVPLGVPLRWHTWFIWGLAGGFPVAVVLSWLYEVTPRGVRRTVAVGVTPPDELQIPRPRLSLSAAVAAMGVVGVVAYAAGASSDRSGLSSVNGGLELPPFPAGTDPGRRAVVPFRVDEGLEYLRSGIVDGLLGWVNPLGSGPEASELRRAWRAIAGPDTADVSQSQARLIAYEVGAPWVVRGSVSRSAPGRVMVTASMESVATGREDARGTIEGPEGAILEMLPRLQAQLVGHVEPRLLETVPQAALEEFAKGVALYEAGRGVASSPYFQRAIAIDPDFGSAWFYYFRANGWYFFGTIERTGRSLDYLMKEMWRNRATMSDRHNALVSSYFGPRGAEHSDPPLEEVIATTDDLATAHPEWWEISFRLADLLRRLGPQYDIEGWERRAVNATRIALRTIPPPHWLAWRTERIRFLTAVDWGDKVQDPLDGWADSLRAWGQAWAENPTNSPTGRLYTRWTVAALLGDTVSLTSLLDDVEDVSFPVRGILSISARSGVPLRLGADQAVKAAAEGMSTEESLRTAKTLQAAHAVLAGQFEAAAAHYRDLADLGNEMQRWQARQEAALAALVEPGLRDAEHDFVGVFYTAVDTASVPVHIDSFDNPGDRLGIRDLWETMVEGSPSRESRRRAELADRPGDSWVITQAASVGDTAQHVYENSMRGPTGSHVRRSSRRLSERTACQPGSAR